MKKYFPLMVAVFALLLSGCASTGDNVDTSDIEVTAKTDAKANMSGYKSYSWVAVGAALNDPEGKWQPPGFAAGDVIKHLIDTEMMAKGYALKARDADLGAAFFLGLDMKSRNLKLGPDADKKDLEGVPAGALVVVLVDMRSGVVVWMGQASGKAQKNAEGENIVDDKRTLKRLKYVVTKMFDAI